MVVWTT